MIGGQISGRWLGCVLVGHVQVDPGGFDVAMTGLGLHGLQWHARFPQLRHISYPLDLEKCLVGAGFDG